MIQNKLYPIATGVLDNDLKLFQHFHIGIWDILLSVDAVICISFRIENLIKFLISPSMWKSRSSSYAKFGNFLLMNFNMDALNPPLSTNFSRLSVELMILSKLSIDRHRLSVTKFNREIMLYLHTVVMMQNA